VPSGATRLALSFDTADGAGAGRSRAPGLVGDGDRFTEGYGRRGIAASNHDDWGDIDGDGDLDLLKGGTEPFLHVYENAGGGRMVDRGRMTSGGEPWTFPNDAGHRAWLSPEVYDWDGDGDADLFVHFAAGPAINTVVRYENVTPRGGPPTFADRGPILTTSGRPVADRITIVDWDGDGRPDVLCGKDDALALHRNVGTDASVAGMTVADGTYLEANGVPLRLMAPRADAADSDGDGDLDLFVGTEDGRVYRFENVGTRTAPLLSGGRMVVYFDYMDIKAGVKVADFDGDGLLDLSVGRYWERAHLPDEPRRFGAFYKNVGTAGAPRFEAREPGPGVPHTEGWQPVDALRQNGVRAADWDGDGRRDLVVGDTDGFVWWFRNTTSARAPVFAEGVRLEADGRAIKVYGEEPETRLAGYARVDVTDWDGDGRVDLLVADGRGWLWLFLDGAPAGVPVLGRGRRVEAAGQPIDGTSRGSVLVTDFDADGKKDVIFAMVGEGPSRAPHWPPRAGADRAADRGFLFYRNLGADRAPVLAAPKWVKAGPDAREIDLTRPNLGDFVDWDGDGRRDLLACEFENNCRLWAGTGPRGPGRPRFGGPLEGVTILKPWTDQMISGLDAVDWNGDGRLDLLTGQGHGGSGVRFYDRGYLDDVLRGTVPRVTVEEIADRPGAPAR
jgi:hypothetical protein